MEQNQKRTLIFTGGILDLWALKEIKSDDCLIGADRGALFLVNHGLQPDISIGDFDSVTKDELTKIRSSSRQWISCDPVMKDLSDTEMAFNLALDQTPDEILLIGALGTRFDHSLANVHLLAKALDRHIPARIVGENNEIALVDKDLTVSKGRYSHISLLPLTMKVTGITLEGFQYPLLNAVLTVGQSLGISNLLTAEEGHVHVESGLLLVIKSID